MQKEIAIFQKIVGSLYVDIYCLYTYNINMNNIQFEWDDNKAQKNIEKHKISFEEACTVFADENAILFDDPEHSQDEERFLLLGFSDRANMLIVCHCYRGENDIIRLISAREATSNEKKRYQKGW